MAGERNAARAAVRWTAEEARAVVDAWQRSGESGAAFARGRGIDPQRLFWWRERLGVSHGQRRDAGSSGFVPVVIAPPQGDRATVPVSVSLPGEARLEVHELSGESAAWVAMVIGAVAGDRR